MRISVDSLLSSAIDLTRVGLVIYKSSLKVRATNLEWEVILVRKVLEGVVRLNLIGKDS